MTPYEREGENVAANSPYSALSTQHSALNTLYLLTFGAMICNRAPFAAG